MTRYEIQGDKIIKREVSEPNLRSLILEQFQAACAEFYGDDQ